MKDSSKARVVRGHAGTLTATLALVLLGSACEKNKPTEEPKPAAAAPAPAPAAPVAKAAPAAPPAPAAKQLEWDDPPEWKRVKPSSSMRRASYEIPPVKGDKAVGELNVFILGGDVEPNIQRWVDEFSGFDPKTLVRSDRTVNDMTQAVVEIPKGRFSGGMGSNTASDNYGLLGAIVVTPAGLKYFFKLTGPAATVKAARAPFYKMLDGMRLEGSPPAPPGSAKTTTPAKPAATPAKAEPAPAKPAPATPAAQTRPASTDSAAPHPAAPAPAKK